MLQFIFGLPASGKTQTVLNTIKSLVSDGKEVVLIVPEQLSFKSERAVLRLLGDDLARFVKVLSFSRLYDEISNEIGGVSGRMLKDSEKIVLMNRTLTELNSELKQWGRYVNSLNFAKTMLDTLGEFKLNAISSDDLKNAANFTNKVTLKNKLNDISLIYDSYDAFLGEKYIDPVDLLTKLYRNLQKSDYFSGKTVFFDSFKAFTGQQFKIIDCILSKADDVYFAITNDANIQREFDIFTNVRRSVQKLENSANKRNVKIAKPIILETTKYDNPKLSSLERLMAGNSVTADLSECLTVCKSASIYDEAEFVARTIRRLVRENGYRFKDFAVISRDSEKYQQAVEYSFKKNGVSLFFDKRVALNSLPFSFAVTAAINALNFSTENILRFHKCGFTNLNIDEISLLENYTYIWNINGQAWFDEWKMDPRGFGMGEITDTEREMLSEINLIRARAIKPFVAFKNEFKENAKQMAIAIINLMDACNAKEYLKSLSDNFSENGNDFSADIIKQGYEAFLGVLDALVIAFGDKSLSVKEFYDSFNLALSVETIGVIPQHLDEVTFGAADRIQPTEAKVVFIIGANQGVFPKNVSNNGIWVANERKALIDVGIEISDNSILASIDENYLVYSNVCAAREKVYISYSANALKGEELILSPFVQTVCDNLSPKLVVEPSKMLTNDNLPETKSAVFSELCRRFYNNDDCATLNSVLNDGEIYSNLYSKVFADNDKILPENAQKLYGKDINLSATKIDTVNRCKFSYFCKYGLRAEKLQVAEFNVLQRGNIAHYVLEKIITDYKDEIGNLTENKLDELTDYYIEEYLSNISGFDAVRDAKTDFLVYRISRSLKEVVRHIAADFRQSDFKPVACEFKIGFSDGIKVEFPYSNGKVRINGSIDRIDEYNGFIRIVDYKTGTKTFKLPDIVYGLNLQMLIYLYSVIRGQNIDDEKAAGILYMPAKRDIKNDGLAMNGLLKADIELHNAMEKSNAGEFVPPISILKNGTVSKRGSTFVDGDAFTEIFDYIEKLIYNTGDLITSGDISVSPIDGRETPACKYCDFKSVCNFENKSIFKVPELSNSEVIEIIKGVEANGI